MKRIFIAVFIVLLLVVLVFSLEQNGVRMAPSEYSKEWTVI
jgi:hypothetical protein